MAAAKNTATFAAVTAVKMRGVFEHSGKSRSGLTEIEVAQCPATVGRETLNRSTS